MIKHSLEKDVNFVSDLCLSLQIPAQNRDGTLNIGTQEGAAFAALAQVRLSRIGPVVAVTPALPEAERLALDLEAFGRVLGTEFPVHLLPELESTQGRVQPENESERSRVLSFTADHEAVFVAPIMALLAPAPDPKRFRSREFILRPGTSEWPPQKLAETLVELDYDNEIEVHVPGEFSARGGILDLFSPVCSYPVRLEYFGDEIESIRLFDPETQRSLEQLGEVRIIPRGEQAALGDRSDTYCALDFFSHDALHVVWTAALSDFSGHIETYGTPDMALKMAAVVDRDCRHVHLDSAVAEPGPGAVQCPAFPLAPAVSAALPEMTDEYELLLHQYLKTQIQRWTEDGFRIVLCADSSSRLDQSRQLLAKAGFGEPEAVTYIKAALTTGLLVPAAKVVILTESELFGPAPERTRRTRPSHYHADHTLHTGTELHHGDFAVHASHGICRYIGLRRVPGDGHVREVIELEFLDDVKVLVPLEQAWLVSRYVGGTRKFPRLSRVGGAVWKRKTKEAAEAVDDLAAELLRIQALREGRPGVAFGEQPDAEAAFNAAFPYEMTVDQVRATDEVLTDMSKDRPMDRLICGDVGFGKTEVAMRAAFRAIQNGRQVAILAPTTILVQQHFLSFSERFRAFPVTVDCLSRFRSRKEQKEVLESLASGGVDIVIGTHRLIQWDVTFHNLGLVIIDEEQRFGVRHKERLKQMRADIDIITMSATPIPRTLYLSMSGLRDMSTIMTPPDERLPVITTVAQYDEDLIRLAIRRELQRGGQVFYLHNRVKTIEAVHDKLLDLVPDATYQVGHGQMPEDLLERAMLNFIEGRVDILICTTIIESGLDIPNANTIIIERADRFGLADLYQLRGRVGRFHQQAYAYLLLPRHGTLHATARERLAAIRKYTQLGVGFKLAMKDLEIRGAGNILGAEQSGHIVAVGFDLYCRLLRDSVGRLKGQPPEQRANVAMYVDFMVFGDSHDENKASAAFSAEYIEDDDLRVECHRRLITLTTAEAVDAYSDELRDRFGPLPQAAKNMILATRVKVLALSLDLHSVSVRGDAVHLEGTDGLLKFNGSLLPRLRKKNPIARLEELVKVIETFIERRQ